MSKQSALIDDLAFTYNIEASLMDSQLADIKQRYEKAKYAKYAKKPEIKKKVFDPAIKAAMELQTRIQGLPPDAFWTESGSVISDLEDNLFHFLLMARDAKDNLPDKPNTRGWADDILARRIALFLGEISKGGNVTNYKDRNTKKYAGNYVKFLEKVLPYFGINADKSQAYAQRYEQNTLKG